MSAPARVFKLSLQYIALTTALLLAGLVALLTYSTSQILLLPSYLFLVLDTLLLKGGPSSVPFLTFSYTVIRAMQTNILVSRCSGQIQILAGTLEEFAQFTHLDVCHLIEHTTKSITQSNITAHTAAESRKGRDPPLDLSGAQLYLNGNPDLRTPKGYISQIRDQIQTVTAPSPTQVHSAYSASDYDLPLTARMSVPTPSSGDPFGDEYEVETPSTESVSPTDFYSQICPRKGFPFSRSKRVIGLLCSRLEPIDCDFPRRAAPLAQPVLIKPRKDQLLPDDQLDLQKELDELFQRINNLPSTVESAVSDAHQTKVSRDKTYPAGPIRASPLNVASPSPLSGFSQPYELPSPVSPLDILFK